MAKYSLARKLTLDTGKPHTVKEAETLIDLFNNVFSEYSDYRTEIVQDYKYDGYLRLSDGWTMFGDNDNHRSIANMPVQGSGSVVLRRMVKYLQEAGLTVVKTLHDAGYCKIPLNDWAQVDLMADCMQRAFQDSFSFLPKHLQQFNHIRLDTNAWGPGIDLRPDLTTPEGMSVKCQEIYVDGRGIRQYEKFSKYFDISLASMRDIL